MKMWTSYSKISGKLLLRVLLYKAFSFKNMLLLIKCNKGDMEKLELSCITCENVK